MKTLKKNQNKSGFTLVEVIVSVAIIGIMSMAFFTMFGFALQNIIKAGDNSQSDFNAQAILESNISNVGITSAAISSGTGSITLNQTGLSYTVNGRVIQVEYPYGNSSYTMTTFVPE